MKSWNEIEHYRQLEKEKTGLHPSHPFYKSKKSDNVKVILTPKQLDDLLSNRISKMEPVIEYIRTNVVPVEE